MKSIPYILYKYILLQNFSLICRLVSRFVMKNVLFLQTQISILRI